MEFIQRNHDVLTGKEDLEPLYSFPHVYEPMEFMRLLAGFMKPGSSLIFSVPNMEVMLKRKYTNCINFEHTVYLNESCIKFLLQSNGFALKTVEYFLEDHSIFFVAEKIVTDSSTPSPIMSDYELNKKLYNKYIDYHKSLVDSINKCIESRNDVFLFGAHIFALSLIAFGLATKTLNVSWIMTPPSRAEDYMAPIYM